MSTSYVDQVDGGGSSPTPVDAITEAGETVAVKVPCRVATAANITLSGLQTIDGIVLVADDRVLVKDQTDESLNGIYIAASGAWSRAVDFDSNRDITRGTRVNVTDGTTYEGAEFRVASDNPVEVGTDDIVFERTGNGDLVGPASSTNSGFAKFDGTTGKLLKDSAAVVSVPDGGTGASALTAFAVLCGGATSTAALQAIASVGTAGHRLTSNGAGALPTFQANIAYSIAMQVKTASGTYTPTAGMTHCLVIATGSGGGGGGADSDGGTDSAGGGGGAGGTAIGVFSAATIGASQTVTINAAGTAGAAAGGNGGNGGNTTFGALLTGSGGSGGSGSGSAPGSDTIGAGGAGGGASGGTLNIDGGSGATGYADVAASGGVGGASFWGGGGRNGATFSGLSAGSAGQAYGSGGGGAADVDNTTGAAGGAGKLGVVFILELIAT